jgi:hypothetical protein
MRREGMFGSVVIRFLISRVQFEDIRHKTYKTQDIRKIALYPFLAD